MIELTRRRIARGWSKNELSRRAAMTAADIGKIESGRLRPYDSQLRKIAVAFGMSPDEGLCLLERAEGSSVTPADAVRQAGSGIEPVSTDSRS